HPHRATRCHHGSAPPTCPADPRRARTATPPGRRGWPHIPSPPHPHRQTRSPTPPHRHRHHRLRTSRPTTTPSPPQAHPARHVCFGPTILATNSLPGVLDRVSRRPLPPRRAAARRSSLG